MQSFTRQGVLDYFDNTWTMTEVLFASLQVRKPEAELSIPLFFAALSQYSPA